MTRPTLYFFALFTLLAGRATAEESWSLMTADLKTEPVVLKSIDAAGLHVATNGGADGNGPERVVPMDRFVELARPVPAVPLAGRFALHLVGGDKIGGEPVAVKGEHLVWNSPAVGETEIPMRLLTGVSKPDAAVSDAQRKDDEVKLANGDTVHGTVADITPAKVSIQTDAGNTDLPLETVVSIAFATTAPGGRDRPGFRVRLDDGSSLLASAVTSDGTTLQVTLPAAKAGAAAGAPRPIELSRVAGIEQVNGPVSWLSSRAPSQSVYIPWIGRSEEYRARMNANYKGEPIYFKDHHYLRGIGVHSYSRLVYPLDGKTYTTFRTRYAIDPDATNGRADVTVRIKLDDKTAYEREHVHAGELSPPVVLDLNGAKSLTLEVDFGANGNSEDRLNWIEPALLKVKPAPEPVEPPPAATTQPATTRPATTQPTTAPSAAAAPVNATTRAVSAPAAPAPPGPRP